MSKDDVYLAHILDAIARIEAYTRGVGHEQFLADGQLQDAVVRRLEIIGEAAKNLTPQARNAHPDVPWQDVMGMRDVLIHRYFGVDLEAVWDTVQADLPELKKALT